MLRESNEIYDYDEKRDRLYSTFDKEVYDLLKKGFKPYEIAERLNSSRKKIYDKYNSTSEGKKLVKYVVGKLLQEGHPIMAIDFIIESGFRYIGFKVGSR